MSRLSKWVKWREQKFESLMSVNKSCNMETGKISVSFYRGIDDKDFWISSQQELPYEFILWNCLLHIRDKICAKPDRSGSLSLYMAAFGLIDLEKNTYIQPTHVFCGPTICKFKFVVTRRPSIRKFEHNNIVWEYLFLQCLDEFMLGELGTIQYRKRLYPEPIDKGCLMKLCLSAFLMPDRLPLDSSQIIGHPFKTSIDKTSFHRKMSDDLFSQINSSKNFFFRYLDSRHYRRDMKECIKKVEAKRESLGYYKVLFFSHFVTAFPQYCFDIFEAKTIVREKLQDKSKRFFIRAYGQESAEDKKTGLFYGDVKVCDLGDVESVKLGTPQPSSEIQEWEVRIQACSGNQDVTLRLTLENKDQALALINMLYGYITLCHSQKCKFLKFTPPSSEIRQGLRSFGPCSRRGAEECLRTKNGVKPAVMQSGFLIYQDEQQYNCFNIASKHGRNDVMHRIEWIYDKNQRHKFIWKKGSDESEAFNSYKELTEALEKKFGPQLPCQRGKEQLDPSNVFTADIHNYASLNEHDQGRTDDNRAESEGGPISRNDLQEIHVISDKNFLRRTLVKDRYDKSYILVSLSSLEEKLSARDLQTTMINNYGLARGYQGENILKFIRQVFGSELSYLFECPSHGPLNLYLLEAKDKVNTCMRMRLALEVVQVLKAVCHSDLKVHGNIRCENLYLFMEDICTIRVKLGDDGLVNFFDNHPKQCEDINDERVPWLAPERRRDLQNKSALTIESEIFAVGTTICEILHSATSFRKLLNLSESDKLKDHFYGEDLGERLKPRALKLDQNDPNCASSKVYDVTKAAWEMVLSCWNEDPMQRPDRFDLDRFFIDQVDQARTIICETEAESALTLIPSEFRETLAKRSPRGIYAFCNENLDFYIDSSFISYEEKDKIDAGHFGIVYKGKMKGKNGLDVEKLVAVKKLKPDKLKADRQLEDFYKEIECAIRLKHENIVESYYFSSHGDIPLLILEYMNEGTLKDYVDRNKEDFSDPNKKFGLIRRLTNFCHQVAKGMEYLAAEDIVHSDLATRNVLLTSKGGGSTVAKVGDFGLARAFAREKTYYTLTELVSCPIMCYPYEYQVSYLEYRGGKRKSSGDVWLFAVMLWEIFSCNQKYQVEILQYIDRSQENVQDFPVPRQKEDDDRRNVNCVVNWYKRGFRLPQPAHMCDDLYKIVRKCWELLEHKRPKFVDIGMDISKLLDPSSICRRS